MIIENMRYLHDEEMIGRLVSEENKLYSRLQRQLMDMTSYGNGTIFEKIQEINEEMTRRLEIGIDLRNKFMLENG